MWVAVLLFLVFLGLKVTDVVSWSWFVVCLPLVVAGVGGVVVALSVFFGGKRVIDKAISKLEDDANDWP